MGILVKIKNEIYDLFHSESIIEFIVKVILFLIIGVWVILPLILIMPFAYLIDLIFPPTKDKTNNQNNSKSYNKVNKYNTIKPSEEEIEIYSQYLDYLSQKSEDTTFVLFRETKIEKIKEEEILQQKIDNYLNNLPNNEQIGKAYERYIGYLYEIQGYQVIFNGIEQGIKDNGIDLICTKDNETHIVQCKNWANKIYNKTVHQLLGSVTEYKIDNQQQDKNIIGIIYTTNGADENAVNAANKLGIIIKTQKLDKTYPLIKCKKDNNTYYLPPEIEDNAINQQYDAIHIDILDGDIHCQTIEQAKEQGFTQSL